MSPAGVTVLFDSPLVRLTGIDHPCPRGRCGCERDEEHTGGQGSGRPAEA
ncbi:MAG: hypothetical protein HOQ10_02310 [Frateuria sp.]|nr:hypothetical protein [Frateuria sp.]NUO71536.1 hypothetical protein [Frateuria sp.]NUR22506.1 hypothetical protein [Frateuria sp.]